MINFLVLVFFFIYSVSLFLIDNIYILGSIFIFNILVSLILKISIKKYIKVLFGNVVFLVSIVLTNMLFSSVSLSLIIGIRLFLTIDFTFIIAFFYDMSGIREAFRYLFYPLKLFKVNIDDLTLIIAVALAFIPILVDEAKMIKLSLKSKGFSFDMNNLIKRPHVYLLTFLNGIFDRLDELEKSLMIKGY